MPFCGKPGRCCAGPGRRWHRTRRRTERIFDDERLRIFRENLLCFNPVRRNERFWESNFELRTQLAGEIAFALNPHRFASWGKNPDAGFHQIFRPRCLRPINGLRNDNVDFFLLQQWNWAWKSVARKSFTCERRRKVSVIAGQVRRDVRACIRQRGSDAVRERADTENHGGGRGLLRFARHANQLMKTKISFYEKDETPGFKLLQSKPCVWRPFLP